MTSGDLFLDWSAWGALGPVLAFIVGVLQAIFPFIPFAILGAANGLVFGLTTGVLITFTGALTGALISFWLARKVGQRWVLQKYGSKYSGQIKKFSGEYGFRAVLIARLIPVIPSPLINILSGVSKINFKQFTLASALGKFPFAVLYTLGGYELTKFKDNELLISIAIGLLAAIFTRYFRKKKKGIS